jgi:lysozyme family protein
MREIDKSILIKDALVFVQSAMANLLAVAEDGFGDDKTLAAIERELRDAADLVRQTMSRSEDIGFEVGETDV